MICIRCGQVNRQDARFCDTCGLALLTVTAAPARSEIARYPIKPLRDIFVGREDEVARLTSALDDALQGHGRLVTLAGEPGIGKTRTARQLEATAIAKGAGVLWGRCQEEGGAPPFWIWIQSIRAYARAADPDELRADLGSGAPDIAEVVPDVRRIFPDLEAPPTLDANQERFRFFDSTAAFLKRAGARRPLVFILDNLHWADRPALLLLEFLASELANSRLLIVGTYRDSELSRRHPLAQTLSVLTKEQLYDSVLLRGLRPPDVSAFLAARTGVVPPRSLVDAVWRQTEGNPLFLSEFVRLLEQDDILVPDRLRGDAIVLPERVPEGVREVIGRRLDRLPPDSNRVLAVASVIGPSFTVDLLQTLLPELPRGRIGDAVEVAVAPGLVDVVPGSPRRYRFTHALIRQTLSDELTTSERFVLHRRIADELERVYGDEVALHAGELAHHLGEAVAPDDKRLVKYCRIAGEQALRVHGYEEAVIHFERALAGKASGPDDDETAAIRFGLGRAQAAALPLARAREAVSTLRQAADYYVATGNTAKAIEVALLPLYPVFGQPTGWTQILDRVLSLVPDSSKDAVRLLSRYGRLMAFEEGNMAAARPALRRALELAQQSNDSALEFQVVSDLANANLADPGSVEWVDAVARALEANAAELREPQAELVARYSAVVVCFIFGDLAGIERFGLPMLRLAEGLRDRFWLSTAHRVRTFVPWLRGDYTAARAASELSLAAAPEEPRDLAIRIQIEFEAGDTTEGERYLDRLIGLFEAAPLAATMECSMTALLIPLLPGSASSPARLELAERAAQTSLGKWSGLTFGTPAQLGHAVAAIIQHDHRRARESYLTLSGEAHPMTFFTTTTRDRILGLLARTFGDDVAAGRHFANGLRFCEDRGLRPELAWISYDFADLLVHAVSLDDRARGVTLLNQAQAMSRDLGMHGLGARADALAQSDDVTSLGGTRPLYPDDLTEREVEVLRLLAAGRTDRVIGDELSISARTVSNHVSRILGKTSSANRTEAATYALRHGLIERNSTKIARRPPDSVSA